MGVAALRPAAIALLFVMYLACDGRSEDPGGGSDDECTGAPSHDIGGSGAACPPCEPGATPERLRQVRVTDSRLLESNTIVLADSSGPQTLWLPDASENVGSFVVVKEAIGIARRITVLVLSGGDVVAEYEATDEHSSRTFVAVGDGSAPGSWLLLDALAP